MNEVTLLENIEVSSTQRKTILQLVKEEDLISFKDLQYQAKGLKLEKELIQLVLAVKILKFLKVFVKNEQNKKQIKSRRKKTKRTK